MEKRWKISPANETLQKRLEDELNILPVTAELLVKRGITEPERAYAFLSPDLKDLYNPFLMKDMDKATERILTAIREAEKICVWGDYDVDGTTGTALFYSFFQELGVKITTYIPNRLKEGYGLNIEGIKRLHKEGVTLIITVDCGISNHTEIEFARTLGMDCIVVDHHEVPPQIPPACAVLNPKQPDCGYPFKALAGVGVAFNLVIAIRAKLRERGWHGELPNLKRYLDIVAIGTVADVVPLVDQNRILVSYGLKELASTKRLGLKSLMDVAGVGGLKPTAEHIAFQLAPRINASGRMDSADTALRLLVTENHREATELARRLNTENSKRQSTEERILREALSMITEPLTDRAIVLAREGWHAGVIGIVASRIMERFTRPTILLSIDGDRVKGSARGTAGCNIIDTLRRCESYLEKYGGHRSAAGLTLKRENLEAFRREFIGLMNSALSAEDLVPTVELDARVTLDELKPRLVDEIEKLSPFGYMNERPLLCVMGANILHTELVKDRHLRVMIKHNGTLQNGIAFDRANYHPIKDGLFDIAFYPYIDEWQGLRTVRLRIEELKPSSQTS